MHSHMITPIEAGRRYVAAKDIIIIGAARFPQHRSFLVVLDLRMPGKLNWLSITPEYIPTSPSSAEIGIMISEVARRMSEVPKHHHQNEFIVVFIPDDPKNRKQIRQISRGGYGMHTLKFANDVKGPICMLGFPGGDGLNEELKVSYAMIMRHLKLRAQGQEPVPREWIENLRAR